jgi:hypothetical protein
MSDGVELYIEVREDSKFSNFYTTFTARGRGRNRVKTQSIPRHRGYAEDIEEAVRKITAVMKENEKRSQHAPRLLSTKIWIHRKRLYRKLIHMRPDELGLTRTRSRPDPRLARAELANVQNIPLPITYTPLEQRWKILTGEK